MREVTIEELIEDNPSIDYSKMTPSDLAMYKQMYLDGLNLTEANATARAQYPINDFEANFVAFFSGSPNLTEEDRGVLLGHWVNVAGGTGFIPVDIISPTGDVLFTIPAVYSTETLQPSDNGSVGGLIAEYMSMREIRANASNVMVENMMDFMKDRTSIASRDPWASFKMYYGLYDNNETSSNTVSDGSASIFV